MPSLVLKLGNSLSMCAGIIESLCLKNNDTDMSNDAINFEKLYRKDWCSDISKEALDDLEKAKVNKAKLLPLAKDIVRLNRHINMCANKAGRIWKIVTTVKPLKCIIANLQKPPLHLLYF